MTLILGFHFCRKNIKTRDRKKVKNKNVRWLRKSRRLLARILTDGHHFDKRIQIDNERGYCGRHAGYYRGNHRRAGQRQYLTE